MSAADQQPQPKEKPPLEKAPEQGSEDQALRVQALEGQALEGQALEGQAYACPEDRKMGTAAAVLFIVNTMVGTGIFSTPSAIFAATGSVGASLVLWLAGGLLAFAGLSVYLEFGLAIPRSGGEKNYLERVYRRPRYLASCVLASNMVLLSFSANNALSFGRYVLFAAAPGGAGDGWPARAVAVACISAVVAVHSFAPKCGLRVAAVLGLAKVGILVFIVCAGVAALAGRRRVPDPRNFDDAFAAGTGDGYGFGAAAAGGPYAYCSALLNIVFSYKGWEGVNYVAGELRNPRRTLAVAAPVAVALITVLYLLANVAYFAAIPKADLARSDVLVAGIFFRNVLGPGAAARCLPVLVALSNLGNVLVTSFARARLNQELAKEGLLPWSRFWASNRPCNAPAAGLLLHWLVSVVVLVALPAGPAYAFIVSLSIYPNTCINTLVPAGLVWLRRVKAEAWSSPWHTPLAVVVVYTAANMFLAVVPWIPPPPESWNAKGYPYFVFPAVGIGVLALGALYWALWLKLLPRLGGYRVVSERTFGDDGVELVRYRKVAVGGSRIGRMSRG